MLTRQLLLFTFPQRHQYTISVNIDPSKVLDRDKVSFFPNIGYRPPTSLNNKSTLYFPKLCPAIFPNCARPFFHQNDLYYPLKTRERKLYLCRQYKLSIYIYRQIYRHKYDNHIYKINLFCCG